MSIEIDVLNGDVFAHADLRVMVRTESGDIVCHVGIGAGNRSTARSTAALA